MIGGTVIGVIRGLENTLLNVQDKGDQCSVRCVERRNDNGKPVAVAIGDSVWWQAGDVMWTPASSARGECGIDFDIHIRKVGYSH